jgi:ABC-2 type transport system ATP-binding protein
MIEIDAVSRSYGDTVAVDDVSLAVRPGEITSLVGPNGAGKSTLMRILLGLEQPDSGIAHIHGVPYTQLSAPLATVGASLDATWLSGGRRARDELRLAAIPNRIPPERVEEVLMRAGLAHVGSHRIRTLSLGMRQRLSIARAILGRPAVLVLDEPTNGLDVDGVLWLRSLVRSYADEGATVLFSSHVLTEIERLADRVVVLQRGRVTLDRVTAADPATCTVLVVADEPARLAALLSDHGMKAVVDGRKVLIAGGSVRAVAELAFSDRLFLESIGETRRSLEDDYHDLVDAMRPGGR